MTADAGQSRRFDLRRIRGVIFDCDGVLFDSRNVNRHYYNHMQLGPQIPVPIGPKRDPGPIRGLLVNGRIPKIGHLLHSQPPGFDNAPQALGVGFGQGHLGYNVMKGYYNSPDATAQAIDPDGWMHSGDLGTIDEDGYLSITGRLKDMITEAMTTQKYKDNTLSAT